MLLSKQAIEAHTLRPVRLHHYKRRRPNMTTDRDMDEHRSKAHMREAEDEVNEMQPVRIHHKRRKIQAIANDEAEDHALVQDRSIFWNLPQEIRDMIYELIYTSLPKDVRFGNRQEICCETDTFISKRWFQETMTYRSRFTTFHLDLSTPSSSRGLGRWQYIRCLHLRLDLRRSAFSVASIARSCPYVEELKVELVHSGVFGCHDRVWPRGLEESSLVKELRGMERLRKLEVGLMKGNFGIVCASCRNVVKGMEEFVMDR